MYSCRASLGSVLAERNGCKMRLMITLRGVSAIIHALLTSSKDLAVTGNASVLSL